MTAESLTNTFAALADPTRRAIIARLAAGEATVNELAEPFDMTQPSISRHLKVLEQAGLISRGRAAQTRPCRLELAPLKEAANWVQQYHDLWEESFDRLAAFLQSPHESSRNTARATGPSIKSKGKKHGRKR